MGARRPIGRRPATSGRKAFLLCFAAASLACGLGLFHTWTRIAVIERAKRLGAAREAGVRLASERTGLRLEVDTLRAAARVDREARVKLSMGPPPPQRVVVLRGARSVRRAPPPAAPPPPAPATREVVSASLGMRP